MELQLLKALKRQRPLCSRDGKALLVGSLHIALWQPLSGFSFGLNTPRRGIFYLRVVYVRSFFRACIFPSSHLLPEEGMRSDFVLTWVAAGEWFWTYSLLLSQFSGAVFERPSFVYPRMLYQLSCSCIPSFTVASGLGQTVYLWQTEQARIPHLSRTLTGRPVLMKSKRTLNWYMKKMKIKEPVNPSSSFRYWFELHG